MEYSTHFKFEWKRIKWNNFEYVESSCAPFFHLKETKSTQKVQHFSFTNNFEQYRMFYVLLGKSLRQFCLIFRDTIFGRTFSFVLCVRRNVLFYSISFYSLFRSFRFLYFLKSFFLKLFLIGLFVKFILNFWKNEKRKKIVIFWNCISILSSHCQ